MGDAPVRCPRCGAQNVDAICPACGFEAALARSVVAKFLRPASEWANLRPFRPKVEPVRRVQSSISIDTDALARSLSDEALRRLLDDEDP